jgi:arginyl-tRNA synthetase
MNIYTYFHERLTASLDALAKKGQLAAGLSYDNVTLEPPRDEAHGDIATNAAMVLAKPSGLNPRELAGRIADKLSQLKEVEKAEVAGPGFINITLALPFWRKVVVAALDAKHEYGRSRIGAGERVNVEFVSANPTGPMHVGHCRGAVFGDALARLLAFAGYDVTREYYINDAGAQVDVLARSAHLRYREALGEDIGEIPAGLYPGDYLVAVGKQLAGDYGRALLQVPESVWLPVVRKTAIAAMMKAIKADLKALDIKHDKFFSERSLTTGTAGDRIAETIVDLAARGLIYVGRLPAPKGKLPDDWEDREQTLFRATDFGDDEDRSLAKADGSYTYFAADMAYHRDKFQRGFTNLIDVWGADHSGYIKRMKAAVAALTEGRAELDVKVCQLVHLMRAGEPVKMSKRAGRFVTLREVVDEVGPDVVRFIMLYRKNDAPIDFDFVKVLEKSRENPVFYVQYAHARVHSVLYRNLRDEFPDIDPDRLDATSEELSLLADKGELALIKKLAQFPRIVEQAAKSHEPHRIAFYLYELASELHGQWNRGTEMPELRFISTGNRALTGARAVLLKAVGRTLATGLGILGVRPVEEMR